MSGQVLTIIAPRKQGVHAHASDLRILRNRSGQLWLGMPSYSIPDGRNFRYEQTVELSRELKRAVEDAVLGEYECSAGQQTAGGAR